MGLEYSVTTTPVKQNSSVEIRVSLLFSKPCKFCSCFSHIIKYVYTHDYTQASSHKCNRLMFEQYDIVLRDRVLYTYNILETDI